MAVAPNALMMRSDMRLTILFILALAKLGLGLFALGFVLWLVIFH